MDWLSLAKEHFSSAETLLVSGHWRGAVSRAYYAAYCGVTWKAQLRGPLTFHRGFQNPSHEAINGLIRNKCGLDQDLASQIVQSCTRMKLARIDADYKPSAFVDESLARDILRDANLLLRSLGAM